MFASAHRELNELLQLVRQMATCTARAEWVPTTPRLAAA